MITVVHSETSTGAANPVAAVAQLCRQYDVLCLVDAISSLACLPLCVDEWGIDLCISASQKGVGAILGLSMVSLSERAWEAMERRETVCRSFALDLYRWRQMFLGREAPRPYPIIPSTHLVFALHEACRLITEEGLEERFRRHRITAAATRAAVRSLGLDLFPELGVATDSLTAVRPPEGIDHREIIARMREAHGVMIAGPPPTFPGGLLRISHMGVQADMRYLAPTLVALERTLKASGYGVTPGTSVQALVEALEPGA